MRFSYGEESTFLQTEVSLSARSTMRTGGIAKRLWCPRTKEEFLFAYAREEENAPRIIGNGSNVLFSDQTVETPLIYTGNLRGISVQGKRVTAAAGTPLSTLFSALSSYGLTGGEFFSGIPGTVGGAVTMNAGAFGKCMENVILSVSTPKGEIPALECGFSYRTSRFLSENLPVLGATFLFEEGEEGEAARSQEKAAKYRAIRKSTQPLTCPSLGSVFRAVNGTPAWEFIHGAGLRGANIGGAYVSEKHANFIVNLGGATSSDVFRLIQRVKARVYERFGVTLVEEIQYIGEFYDSYC